GPHWVAWKLPPLGYFLLYSDGAAELRDVQEGLQLTKNLEITQLIMELDALWVMNILSRPFKANHLLGTQMNDCLVLIRKDWAMDVRHILWKGNQCADHLANLAQAEASASVY
ncbi:hypothetical protein Gotri_009134, partial [Gossypium trilobum]|nr:hypothetical protein [Gossypium trilobum]